MDLKRSNVKNKQHDGHKQANTQKSGKNFSPS